MAKFTIFDSNYSQQAKKPTKRMSLSLYPTEMSKALLTQVGLPIVPEVSCILDEMPDIKMNFEWKPGYGSQFANYIDVLAGTDDQKDNPVASKLISTIFSISKITAGKGYVQMPHTNQFSQNTLEKSSILGLNLKFRIYKESNLWSDYRRYNLQISDYKKWLQVLFTAVMPLRIYNISSALENIKDILAASTNEDSPLLNLGREAKDLGNNTIELVQTFDLGTHGPKIVDNITNIDEFLKNPDIRGHISFRLNIPGLLKSSDTVDWIVTSMDAKPSLEFITINNRPKPLYMDFDVKLETNQKLSRNQIVSIIDIGQLSDIPKMDINGNQIKFDENGKIIKQNEEDVDENYDREDPTKNNPTETEEEKMRRKSDEYFEQYGNTD